MTEPPSAVRHAGDVQDNPARGSSAPIGVAAEELLARVAHGDRAAAFARVVAAGCASLADDADAAEPGRATDLTTRAARLSTIAGDLSASSKLWRSGGLD